MLPWKKFQKNVFFLKDRICKVSQIKNYKLVHKLQRLLFKSNTAKFLALRKVMPITLVKDISALMYY